MHFSEVHISIIVPLSAGKSRHFEMFLPPDSDETGSASNVRTRPKKKLLMNSSDNLKKKKINSQLL